MKLNISQQITLKWLIVVLLERQCICSDTQPMKCSGCSHIERVRVDFPEQYEEALNIVNGLNA